MLKSLAWAILKPVVTTWLQTRALQLPISKLAEIAKKLNVDIAVVNMVNDAIKAEALTELDRFKP